jgi:hypothetical protein
LASGRGQGRRELISRLPVRLTAVADDYCEMCDLPLSTCVHGMPKPAPEPVSAPPKRATEPRVRRAATPRVSVARVPGTPAKAVVHKWTRPEELKGHVVRTLQDAGGALDADGLFEELETRLEEVLKPGDREAMPTGELRWRYAARKARKELIDDGLLEGAKPGAWVLTSEGRDLTA